MDDFVERVAMHLCYAEFMKPEDRTDNAESYWRGVAPGPKESYRAWARAAIEADPARKKSRAGSLREE